MSHTANATRPSRRKSKTVASGGRRPVAKSGSGGVKSAPAKVSGTLKRVARSIKRFVTDPEYPPLKKPRPVKRLHGELIA